RRESCRGTAPSRAKASQSEPRHTEPQASAGAAQGRRIERASTSARAGGGRVLASPVSGVLARACIAASARRFGFVPVVVLRISRVRGRGSRRARARRGGVARRAGGRVGGLAGGARGVHRGATGGARGAPAAGVFCAVVRVLRIAFVLGRAGR